MNTLSPPERLTMWKARRAGGRITIYARGADGRDRKVTNVDTIEAAAPFPIAVDKAGQRFELA